MRGVTDTDTDREPDCNRVGDTDSVGLGERVRVSVGELEADLEKPSVGEDEGDKESVVGGETEGLSEKEGEDESRGVSDPLREGESVVE
jgi:hypothetical protein